MTWDERCDVVEISCGEEGSDDALDMESSDDEPSRGPDDHADPFFQGGLDTGDQSSADNSYEIMDEGKQLALDADTSISGLVDEMFGPYQSTPPRHGTDIPTDLDTEDGIPFGRSHHAERAAHHHQHDAKTPPPIPFNPTDTSSPMRGLNSPHDESGLRSNSDFLDDYENDNFKMLPESPSPVKPRRNTMLAGSPIPPLRLSMSELPQATLSRSTYSYACF